MQHPFLQYDPEEILMRSRDKVPLHLLEIALRVTPKSFEREAYDWH